ncbi:MBL fold metallo-hydrolase [Candidatus Woesearchaeota archaeon]|nr:MBL fold metallo-hydrolase [Candidatus Woesearchaeota archaeon]
MIEICAVGGYDEVGANMTAIKINDDVIICDMGISVEKYIEYTNDDDIFDISVKQLINSGSVPDIRVIDDWKDKVRAIAITHAHLDHCAAAPFIAKKFDAPIYCTPFTAEIIKRILRDEKIKIPNKIRSLNPNSFIKINDNITLEFINVTHSTPQAVLIAVHSSEGCVMYANDFKIDNCPIVGKKTNMERLKEIKDIKCLIMDSLYADRDGKTPSEPVARELLKDVLIGTTARAVLVTTFSSHIARLKTIVQIGKELKRKIVFLGRSLGKYVDAAESINLVRFTEDVEVVRFKRDINRKIRDMVEDGIDKYLIVLTGHQGEQKAVLSRIANGQTALELNQDDVVVFSCKVIPTESNIKNRLALEEKLREHGVRIYTKLHVSGHASREDMREFLEMIQPQALIPAHAEMEKRKSLASLAKQLNIQHFHLPKDGDRITL